MACRQRPIPFLYTDAGGKPLEQLAVIVTDLSDGKHEVRLVRRILPG